MQAPLLREQTYVIFDLETTGLYAEDGDEIIEIGALVVENFEITEKKFHSLINPGKPIPAISTSISGICDKDVCDSPAIIDILPQFVDFCGNSVWVAHNAKFDLSFVLRKLAHMQLPPRQNLVVDTVALSRFVFPYETSHSLDVVMARLGIPRSGGRHRSLDDCKYTAMALIEFLKMLEKQGVTTLPQIEQAFVKHESVLKREKPKTRSLFG